MNKIELLKRLDAIAGFLLCRLLPRTTGNGRGAAGRRIFLIRPGGIGDAVLLAPTIKALKKKFPEAAITVLAEKRNAGVFALIPGVTKVLRYDVPREFIAAFRLKPDLTIDTEQWHRLSAVVARLTGAGTLIGFGTNERARLFHHAIPYSHDDYEAASFMRLLTPLGIAQPVSLATPFLSVPATAQARAIQILAPLEGQPFIVLFPGASIPERRWGADRFGQVAASLASRGYKIVIVGGKENMATATSITANSNGLNLAGQTNLAETAAIIGQSAMLISGDSGILHIGVGLGTPTVSLFGPGIAPKWAPKGLQHRVLNHHLPCSPCTTFGYTQKCRHHAKCIQEITPDEVVQAAIMLLPKPYRNSDTI
ncbi:MAG: glycosyltransferase family 9 protein [Deltaproteobacteria bacterium]|nr:glycosyltransferase family 9 protein [Deltaproteobacteria bacterium]